MSALDFVNDWIAAWNCKDLERVLQHYDDNVVFSSPRIAAAFQRSQGALGDATGTLRGREALRPYFAEAIAKIPDLSLTVTKVTAGVGGKVAVVYTRESGSTVVEVFRLSEQHKVLEAEAFYDLVA